ncbi:MAG: hypothetical protein AAF958_13610 [Planctomycetota bacterium]
MNLIFRTFAFAIVAGALFPMSVDQAQAGILGHLGPTFRNDAAAETLEVDFFLTPEADLDGQFLEAVNLDVFGTRVNSTPLVGSGLQRVGFELDGAFTQWGLLRGNLPGTTDSQFFADWFSGQVGAVPVELTRDQEFLFGRLSFDYSGLGLGSGDQVTFNIGGRDDRPGQSTTVATVFGAGRSSLVNITPKGDPSALSVTFTLGGNPPPPPPAIPEPATMTIWMLGTSTLMLRRRRKRHRRS